MQETNEENDIEPKAASQTQDTAKNAIETGTVGHEVDLDENEGERYPEGSYGLFRNVAAIFCGMNTEHM